MAKIKICGLRRPEDIEAVNILKPDFCGFIINFPKSHRSIDPDKLRELTAGLDKEQLTPVGVFVNQPPELVAGLLNEGVIAMAQLHGSEDEEYISRLKSLSDKPVIKAFAVKSAEVLSSAAQSSADYVLLDQGQGSGKTFDWSLLGGEDAKKVFGESGLPKGEWFLAGGLNEGNIADAIKRFNPYAVDLSGAVETDGFKDFEKIKKIIDIVREN